MIPASRIFFDNGPDGQACLFEGPSYIIEVWDPADVETALNQVQAALDGDQWVAGFASYELGYVLEPKLHKLLPVSRRMPLMVWAVFDGPVSGVPIQTLAAISVQLSKPEPLWDETAYAEAFAKVAAYIAAGDIYQTNLTFPMTAKWAGDPWALYQKLSAYQSVGHGAFVDLGAGPVILSRSPELFFEIDAQGRISTRPMKGTLPRGATEAEDHAFKTWLSKDIKNRAENLMIVDLLRNDISRVAQTGSVRVPELFHVESYATVHQMTSLVEADLQKGVGFTDILKALFPCGSITGAPKIRAMEIIHALEPEARDVYCGSIGWFAPDGRAGMNVAIRTISLFEGGQARLNVGGGVVYDSTARSEYEEALWKARYADLSLMN
ncbi:MAG: aminodeoxychorismate synthase component I [Pseudomonadota bacterium]